MGTQQMKGKAKNICRYCGGKLVIEYFGNYGAVYPLKRNGEEGKRRIKRVLYEESGSDYLIYCQACGRQLDATETEEREIE